MNEKMQWNCILRGSFDAVQALPLMPLVFQKWSSNRGSDRFKSTEVATTRVAQVYHRRPVPQFQKKTQINRGGNYTFRASLAIG